MKNTKPTRFLIAALWASTILLLSSCREKTDLLDLIPADTPSVVTINAEKLLASTGCQVKNGKAELSQPLAQILQAVAPESKQDILDFIKLGCVELRQVIFASDHEGSYLLFSITDPKGLKNFLNDSGTEFRKEGDFEIAELDNGTCLLTKEGIGWLCPDQKEGRTSPSKRVDSILERSKKLPLKAIEYKEQFLSEDHLAAAFCSEKSFSGLFDGKFRLRDLYKDKKYDNAQIAWMLDAEGASIKLTARMFSPKGERLEIYPYNKRIDPSFLKYLNREEMAVVAVAADQALPWGRLLSGMQEKDSYGYEEESSFDSSEMIKDIVESLDGTLAIAAGPAAGVASLAEPSIANWDFVIVAQFKRGKAEEAFNSLEMLLGFSGLRYSSTPTSITLSLPMAVSSRQGLKFGRGRGMASDLTIDIELDGNTIVVSNRRISAGQEAAFSAELFEGKAAVFSVGIPQGYLGSMLKLFGFDIPMGMDFTFTIDQMEAVAAVSLTGTDGEFLEALLDLCDQFM